MCRGEGGGGACGLGPRVPVCPTAIAAQRAADEGCVAAALRAAGATVMARHGATAAVAQWEVRLLVPDASGAWRLVLSSPTGKCSCGDSQSTRCHYFLLMPAGPGALLCPLRLVT